MARVAGHVDSSSPAASVVISMLVTCEEKRRSGSDISNNSNLYSHSRRLRSQSPVSTGWPVSAGSRPMQMSCTQSVHKI